MIATCTAGIADVVKQANAFMKAKKYEMAYRVLHDCKQHMTDPKALALYERATVESTKISQAIIEQSERAERAARKRRGVSIGMSEMEVLESSWGKPNKINRTTRASGTSEQWVYDGGYLYFENNILTAIQN